MTTMMNPTIEKELLRQNAQSGYIAPFTEDEIPDALKPLTTESFRDLMVKRYREASANDELQFKGTDKELSDQIIRQIIDYPKNNRKLPINVIIKNVLRHEGVRDNIAQAGQRNILEKFANWDVLANIADKIPTPLEALTSTVRFVGQTPSTITKLLTTAGPNLENKFNDFKIALKDFKYTNPQIAYALNQKTRCVNDLKTGWEKLKDNNPQTRYALHQTADYLKETALGQNKVGKIIQGATVSLGIKAAFTAAATASGAGLVVAAAAVGASTLKTGWDVYSAKRSGEAMTKGQIVKKFTMNTGLYGLGAALPFSSEIIEMIPDDAKDKLSTSAETAKQQLQNLSTMAKNGIASATQWFSNISFSGKKEEIAQTPKTETAEVKEPATLTLLSEADNASPAKQPVTATAEQQIVEETLEADPVEEQINLDELPPLERIAHLYPELEGKAIWEMRNHAHEITWVDGNPQPEGMQLYQMLADHGDKTAMENTKWFEERGFVADPLGPKQELANLDLTGQAEALRDSALNGNMQAKNDSAIGLLNGMFGFTKDFDLGLTMLDEAAGEGHAKSIKDMKTLIELGKVDIDMVSTETRLELELLNDNTAAACSRSLDVCQYSESVDEGMRGKLKAIYTKLASALPSGSDIITLSPKQEVTLVASANIK